MSTSNVMVLPIVVGSGRLGGGGLDSNVERGVDSACVVIDGAVVDCAGMNPPRPAGAPRAGSVRVGGGGSWPTRLVPQNAPRQIVATQNFMIHPLDNERDQAGYFRAGAGFDGIAPSCAVTTIQVLLASLPTVFW